ncbi:peptidase M20, partial [Escherichia coli]
MPQQAIVSADRAVGASEWIKDQRENMLSLLADIVNIDSGSFDKPGVARV